MAATAKFKLRILPGYDGDISMAQNSLILSTAATVTNESETTTDIDGRSITVRCITIGGITAEMAATAATALPPPPQEIIVDGYVYRCVRPVVESTSNHVFVRAGGEFRLYDGATFAGIDTIHHSGYGTLTDRINWTGLSDEHHKLHTIVKDGPGSLIREKASNSNLANITCGGPGEVKANFAAKHVNITLKEGTGCITYINMPWIGMGERHNVHINACRDCTSVSIRHSHPCNTTYYCAADIDSQYLSSKVTFYKG